MSRSPRGSNRSSPSRPIPIRSFPHSSATDPAQRGRGAATRQVLFLPGTVSLALALPGAICHNARHLRLPRLRPHRRPATIEILIVLSELTELLPLMILVTSRPDHDGGSWDFRFNAQRNDPHRLTELSLIPLRPDESQRLVEHLLKVAELP